jgi:peptide/nickel transport system substrate-binding protein
MRKLIIVNMLVIFAMLLGACAPATSTPTQAPAVEPTKVQPTEAVQAPTPTTEVKVIEPTPEPTLPPAATYSESPLLAERVKAGKLPPVEKRLPDNPRVIKAMTSEKGSYSGEMRMGMVGTSPEWGGFLFVAAWEHLVNWNPTIDGIEYNLAESIDISPDVKEYTIHLRKGLKWSDGEPYNADDIMFYINDVVFDPDLSPTGPVADWLPTDMAKDFKAEKIDDTTVKLIFPKPYGVFLYNVAGWSGRMFSMYPKHYLQQFHKKYNDKVDELVKADGSTDWMTLFYKMGPDTWGNPGRWYTNVDMPSLYPWIITQPLGSGTQLRMERNPYYYKVDEQGNQLPYIDSLLGIAYQDGESRTFAMLNGELDFIAGPGEENRVIYHEAKDEGKPIQIRYLKSDGANSIVIHFNQTLDDPVKAEVYANKDFRIGMSYAINRPEIIEVVFNGQGEPSQVAPFKESPFYVEGMDTQYVEYDVAKANEFLDKVLPKKDSANFRLDKNGKRFSIVFFVQNDLTYGTNWVQIAEMLVGYWKKVGIEVTINSMAGPQYDENRRKSTIDATIGSGEGGAGITPILDPRNYVPMNFNSYFSQGWYGWRVPDPSGATVAVEPPDWAKEARAKYDAVIVQTTTEKQIEQMRGVIQEAKDRFYVIGISRPGPMYYPFHARLGGIPETWYDGWNWGVQKILFPEQWFLKQ